MRDSYFYKSLIATMAVYIVLLAGLVGFVLAAGLAGVFIIAVIIIYFLCYFYGVFDRIKRSGK